MPTHHHLPLRVKGLHLYKKERIINYPKYGSLRFYLYFLKLDLYNKPVLYTVILSKTQICKMKTIGIQQWIVKPKVNQTYDLMRKYMHTPIHIIAQLLSHLLPYLLFIQSLSFPCEQLSLASIAISPVVYTDAHYCCFCQIEVLHWNICPCLVDLFFLHSFLFLLICMESF